MAISGSTIGSEECAVFSDSDFDVERRMVLVSGCTVSTRVLRSPLSRKCGGSYVLFGPVMAVFSQLDHAPAHAYAQKSGSDDERKAVYWFGECVAPQRCQPKGERSKIPTRLVGKALETAASAS